MKNGGRRPGAGRKLKAATILKKMEQEQRIETAEQAFAFEKEVMNNAKVPWGIRLAAAQDIQDRVFGKPKQAMEHSGSVTLEGLLADSNPPREKL